MRFFLVSYHGVDKYSNQDYFGSAVLAREKFPTIKDIKSQIEGNTILFGCILNIFEFKNEQDFKDFVKEM